MDDKRITKLIEELYMNVANMPTQFLRKAEKMLKDEKISFSEVDKLKRFVVKKQNKGFVKHFNVDKFPAEMQKTIKSINKYTLKDDKAPQVDGTLLEDNMAKIKKSKPSKNKPTKQSKSMEEKEN